MSTRFKDLSGLGDSLRRVRVADRPLEGGGKKVWHQGSGGVEIISFVDASGHVTRQESYAERRVVVWRDDGPLLTGELRHGVQTLDGAGEALLFDAALNGDAVRQALSLIEGFKGEDNYLAHLREVLRVAVANLPSAEIRPGTGSELRRVTRDQGLPAVPPPALPPAAPRRMWLVLAIGVLVIGVGALLVAHR